MLRIMPELPDITAYIEALRPRIVGQPVQNIRLQSPFLLRTFDPPPESTVGKPVIDVSRLGKRIGIHCEGELYLVLHLMIAGRLKWKEAGARLSSKQQLAAFDFPTGSLVLTEAGTKKRASLHIAQGRDAFEAHRPPGLEVLDCTEKQFVARLRSANHTLKRALTNPRLFSGIGNAYSDEISHRAGLSPVMLTSRLDDESASRLFNATREVMREWIERLRLENGEEFPKTVTAFRPEMAVHGRYGLPCPVCQTPVQRIRYAENETNYCARCQNGGRVLADRSLSRLLKDDWPRRIEDWE